MRRAARVDPNQEAIVAALRAAGAHVTSLAGVGQGVPDLLVSYRNLWRLLEVKRPLGPRGGSSGKGQRLRETQEAFRRSARAPVAVVRTAEEALAAIGASGNGEAA